MLVFAYVLLMILKLKEGESVEYVCKISGITVSDLEKLNGYLPKANQYFYIPKENKYIIKVNDNLLSIQRKTKLSIEDITRRVSIEVGKVFYY